VPTPSDDPRRQRRTRSGLRQEAARTRNLRAAKGRARRPSQRALTPAERRRQRRAELLGRRSNGRRRRRGLRLALILLSVFSSLTAAGMGALFISYNTELGQLPDAATLAAMEPPLDTHVYARDGTLLHIFHTSGARHEHVALADVSKWAKTATIDVEDKRFYVNSSWDLARIIKAGWGQVRHDNSAGGASTITEQLAKVSFLEDTGTLDYKVKQFILGTQIEANFSKDQILEMYLNRIPYGNHAIGLESAAEIYFHKTAKTLDLAEASMLVGLPNSPTVLNPLLHDKTQDVNPRAKDRQGTVLQSMVNNGDITEQQLKQAFAEKLTFHGWWEAEPDIAPDFTSYLLAYLQEKYGDAFIEPGGWDIHTSLDLGKQQITEKTVSLGVASIKDRFNAHDGAMVSIDPHTGEVLSMIGTYNYDDTGVGDLNMATRRLQPGSTIKLFTYTAAIASRQFTATTGILDAPITFPDADNYQPHNYDRRYHGVCPLQICLGNSFNIPAVKVEAAVGIPYITNLEIAAGLTSLNDATVDGQPRNRPYPNQYAATLGALTYGVTPLELADGAATIADLGVHHDPAPVLAIVDRTTKKTLYTHDAAATARRVVPENVAFIIDEITSNDNNRVLEFGRHSDLTLPDRRVSAKTGTTDFFVSNWTVGWTPDLVSVVWVGNPTPSCLKDADRPGLSGRLRYGDNIDDPFTPSELSRYGLQPSNDHCGHLEGSTGITGAAPIWHDFMSQALAATPAHWYERPSDVQAIGRGDDATFYLPGTLGGCAYNCAPSGHAPRPTVAPTPKPG
jgi:penicillin-binding protein 1A